MKQSEVTVVKDVHAALGLMFDAETAALSKKGKKDILAILAHRDEVHRLLRSLSPLLEATEK